jgi:hypothetical protein
MTKGEAVESQVEEGFSTIARSKWFHNIWMANQQEGI